MNNKMKKCVFEKRAVNAYLLGAIVGKFLDTPVLATVHGRALSLALAALSSGGAQGNLVTEGLA